MSLLETIANGTHTVATHVSTAFALGATGLYTGLAVEEMLERTNMKAENNGGLAMIAGGIGAAAGIILGTHVFGADAHAYLQNQTHVTSFLYGLAGAGIGGGAALGIASEVSNDTGQNTLGLGMIVGGLAGLAAGSIGYATLQYIAR